MAATFNKMAATSASVRDAACEIAPVRHNKKVADFEKLSLRILADGSDRIAWLKARSQGVTASDAAKLATDRSIDSVARNKIYGYHISDNAYLRHGREREPVLAAWSEKNYGFKPSAALFRSEDEERHLATPDGITFDETGEVLLAEIKTTNKPWTRIPKHYLRQIWWQQYVLGAERSLIIWEEHNNFVPVRDEPEALWIERNDQEIAQLVRRADILLDMVYTHLAEQIERDYFSPMGGPF